MSFACKKNCKKADRVTCYSPTILEESKSYCDDPNSPDCEGNPGEQFCKNDPELVIPCDCFDDKEFTINFDYNQLHADVVPRCIYEGFTVAQCTPPLTCPTPPTSNYSVDDPYFMPISYLTGGDEIFAQKIDPLNQGVPLYNFDNTFLSHDRISRPIYFEFHLGTLDETNDELRFIVKHASSGTLIADQTINNDPSSYEDILRFYGTTSGNGTLTLDIALARNTVGPTPEDYTIAMLKNGTQVASSTFKVQSTFVKNSSPYTERCMNLSLFTTPNYNWPGYLSSGTGFVAGLNNVFGAGKSNIRFLGTSFQVELGSGDEFIDIEDEMILKESVLSFTGSAAEIDDGVNEWWERLSLDQNWGFGYQNKTAIIEVDHVDMYSFDNIPPTNVSGTNGSEDFRSFAYQTSLFGLKLGATYPYSPPAGEGPNLTPYYSGCVIYRKIIQDIFDFNQSSFVSGVDSLGIVLWVIYHELGHTWALDGNAGDQCCGDEWYHLEWTRGENAENICLWEWTRQKLTSDKVKFINQAVTSPTYCEFHRQVFLNQIIPQ